MPKVVGIYRLAPDLSKLINIISIPHDDGRYVPMNALAFIIKSGLMPFVIERGAGEGEARPIQSIQIRWMKKISKFQ